MTQREPLRDAPQDPASTVSRRGILKGGLAGAAAAGLAGSQALAQDAQPLSYGAWLLDRTTYGGSDEMRQELATRGWEGFLEWQLDHLAIDDSVGEAFWSPFLATLPMTPYEILVNYQGTPNVPVIIAEAAPILRGWKSRRQLFHVMCEYWSNVQNTFLLMGAQQFFYTPFHEQVICTNALGNYRQMVRGAAEGASMLFYLNQVFSNATSPIENYARELMELHTLGLSDNPNTPTFTEADVVALAEALTGWSFIIAANPTLGDFTFIGGNHTPGNKTVVGLTVPSISGAGVGEGQDLLDHLATHPNTAIHMARRLCHWFIGEHCPQAIVDKVSDAYLFTAGDIKEVLRKLFEPDTYRQLKKKQKRKIRRPLNAVNQFLQVTDPALNGAEVLLALQKMGQLPGTHPAPDGFHPENSAWIDGIQPRIEFFFETLRGTYPGLTVSDARLDVLFPSTPHARLARQANLVATGGTLPQAEETLIQQYLDNTGGIVDPRRDALALAFSSPSQMYLY